MWLRLIQMAADVCAEKLPSTSHASISTSASSTAEAPEASQEADQIASSSTSFLESCYVNKAMTSTAADNRQDDEEAESAFAISSLPSEVHLHIFKHLPRYDIDNCKFVCKRWKELIDRNGHSLRKHYVKFLDLREYKSQFILTINCFNFAKRWTFYERSTNRRSPGLGKRRYTKSSGVESAVPEQEHLLQQEQEQHHHSQQQQPVAKLPHLLVYVGQSAPPGTFLPVLVPSDLRNNAKSMEDHNERKQREHTPPQIVCERLAKYFHEADIHCLRLTEMRFTDCFVDRLRDTFGNRRIRCSKLEISLCKLNYITPEKFHQFLQMVECEKISLLWLRGNHGHLNSQLLSLFLCVRSLKIVALTPEVTIGDDQFLADFLNDKPTKNHDQTVLRLDCCSITTSGLCRAIEKWMQTNTHWTVNLCLVSELIFFDDVLKHFSVNKTECLIKGAFRLAHPQDSTKTLLLWNDEDGVHVAGSRNTVS